MAIKKVERTFSYDAEQDYCVSPGLDWGPGPRPTKAGDPRLRAPAPDAGGGRYCRPRLCGQCRATGAVIWAAGPLAGRRPTDGERTLTPGPESESASADCRAVAPHRHSPDGH